MTTPKTAYLVLGNLVLLAILSVQTLLFLLEGNATAARYTIYAMAVAWLGSSLLLLIRYHKPGSNS